MAGGRHTGGGARTVWIRGGPANGGRKGAGLIGGRVLQRGLGGLPLGEEGLEGGEQAIKGRQNQGVQKYGRPVRAGVARDGAKVIQEAII